MYSKISAIFLAFACGFSLPASAIQRCELGGKSVNPNNGNETAGLTGILSCKDESSGKLTLEQELRNGKNIGLERFFDRLGNIVKERTINDRGNTHGVERTFWPNGQIKSEATSDNGQTQGATRQFYETGKLRRLSFIQDRREQLEISFNPDGSYAELRCHTRSLLTEDRKPCGFEGKVETALMTLKGNRRALQTWEHGMLLTDQRFYGNGELESDMRIEQGRLVHKRYHDTKNQLREERIFETSEHFLRPTQGVLVSLKQWAVSGQMTLHNRYIDGKVSVSERWHLNGAIKEKITTNGHANLTRFLRESFSDEGKIFTRETINAENQPIGLKQIYFENGKIMREDIYSEPDIRGRTSLTRRKVWDESGRVVSDDEILEDGSRKR